MKNSNILKVIKNSYFSIVHANFLTVSELFLFLYVFFFLFFEICLILIGTLSGRLIFNNAKLKVPYKEIMTYVIALIVPLAIGYLIQRYLNRVAQFMTRIIKGFSSLLIIFIIIFAIVTNMYLFQLFSWKVRTSFIKTNLFNKNWIEGFCYLVFFLFNVGFYVFLLY